ncbi:MAG: hypothetical protein VZR27_04615, partial [Acutalibacteraceae bacterium]|nr:hypothetical protein [Acutalibacteraceae bacterium]
MNLIQHELKKSAAKLLALMLMLSMVTGVLGITAYADEATVQASVKQEPIVTYYFGSDTGFCFRYNAFSILVDDPSCDLEHVSGINYVAEFSNGEAVSGTWNGRNYSYSTKVSESEDYGAPVTGRSNVNAYSVISNMNTVIITPNTFPKVVSKSKMENFTIEILFENGTALPVNTSIEKENFHINFDGQNNTSKAMVINLSHYSSITQKDFYELDNAIFGKQALYDETSGIVYADIESKDNVKIPMNDMTGTATLVQTRIGDNVVYNAPGAVDFQEYALPSMPQGADYGRVFYMPDGTYSSEEDVHLLLQLLLSENPILVYNGKMYPGLTQQDFYEPLVTAKSPEVAKLGIKYIDEGELMLNVYTGLPNTQFTREDIDKLMSDNPKLFEFGDPDDFKGYFKAQFNKGAENNNIDVLKKLRDFANAEGTPKSVQEILFPIINPDNDDYNEYDFYGKVEYSLSSSQNNNTYTTNSLNTAINTLESKKNGLDTCNAIVFKYEAFTEGRVENIRLVTEGFKAISDFLIQEFGVSIVDPAGSVILDLDNAEKMSAYDYLESKGVVETVGTVQSLFKNFDYKYLKYGKCTSPDFAPQPATADNAEKTFVNGELSVSADSMNIKKGVSYNIINQVQIINDFESEGLGLINVSENGRSWTSKGNTYFTKGEFITSSPVYTLNPAAENAGSGDPHNSELEFDEIANTEIVKVRNTEYKWGEIAFASRPAPVTELNVDENYLVSFTKPDDEGFGITDDGKTNADSFVRVNSYKIKLYDAEGNLVYRTTILRDEDKESVSIPRPLIEEGKQYKVVVCAVNPIGDSDPAEYDIFIDVPGIEIDINATGDQAFYYSDETVVFEETITNTSPVALTNVTVTQDLFGEYETNAQVIVKLGTTAQIPDLEPKQSFTLTYSVSASLAENGILTQKAEVTAAEQVSSSDVCEVSVIDREPETDDSNSDSSDNTDTQTDDTASESDNMSDTDSSSDNDNSDNTDSSSDNDNSDNTDSSSDNDNSDNTDSSSDNDNS